MVAQHNKALSEALASVLLERHSLELPKIGEIKVVHKGSEIVRKENGQLLLTPPSKKLEFKPASNSIQTAKREEEGLDSELTMRINELSLMASKQDNIQIEGFGHFQKGEEWAFDPAAQILSKINFREARLPVVDLSGNYVATDDARVNLQMEDEDVVISSDGDSVMMIEPKTEPKSPIHEEAEPAQPKSEWQSYATILAIMLALVIVAFWVSRVSQTPRENEDKPQPSIVETPVQAQPEPPAPPKDVLKGAFDSRLSEFYTLVLFSLRNQSSAENVASELRSQGYNAFLQEFELQGRPAYRVAVGQFLTIEAATEHMNQLPEQYQRSNFVRRFNQNNLITE